MSWKLRRANAQRAVFILLGMLFLALGAYEIRGTNGILALRRKMQEEKQWRERNEALQRQNNEIEKRIHELRTDPKTIEKIAREELMLAGSGEKILLAPQKK